MNMNELGGPNYWELTENETPNLYLYTEGITEQVPSEIEQKFAQLFARCVREGWFVDYRNSMS